MKTFLQAHLFLLFFSTIVHGQVFDPMDEVVRYDAENPPETPAWGEVHKWVATNRLSWETESYKPYYYNGMAFRLKYPKNYDSNRLEKYPMILMLHGRGEKGSIYDNEYSMKHGGKIHRDAIDNGEFDGFMLYPQSQNGYWDNYFSKIHSLLNNHIIQDLNVDRYRISVHGLSSGGQGTWKILIEYPKLFASAIPMSAAANSYLDGVSSYKYTPIWNSQGGKDTAPTPYTSESLMTSVADVGGNVRYTLYPNLGHGVWNTHYQEDDFFPYLSRANKLNPVVLDGELVLVSNNSSRQVYDFIAKNEFCPAENISATIGVTPGFENYQWRKDGELIPNANTHELIVGEIGVYDVRVMEGGIWSYWSPTPIEVNFKEATQTPPISLAGLSSYVLPSLDGMSTLDLQLPEGYIEYSWYNADTELLLSTERIFTAANPGNYKAKVKEQFGCSSLFSEPFKVVDANGGNEPEPAVGLIGSALSKTSIELNWDQSPNPSYNESGFEVYRGTQANGPYDFVYLTESDITTFVDNGLDPNTEYYYLIRAINNNGASLSSNEASVKTQVDNVPPTAPARLSIAQTSSFSVDLYWQASTDDVGVYKYDVYNGPYKSVVTEDTFATVYNLLENEIYNFTVKARDITGNESASSNQVTAATVNSGLTYKYYKGSWSSLPDFNSLVPNSVGKCNNFDITLRDQNDNFGFLFEGYINIPVSGNYTFETYSDDGSKLYIGEYNHNATALVDNDGLHGGRYREGTIYLTEGSHPIAVTFFERGGGEVLRVYWKNTAHGVTSRELIPDEAFKSDFEFPGNPPEPPTQLRATALSYDKIKLEWQDNSTNENGFEIYRSKNVAGPFNTIATIEKDIEEFIDENLDPETTYYYRIQAVGKYGESDFSDEVKRGVNYSYYEVNGLSTLPDFNSLIPLEEGVLDNFSLSVRNRNDNFAFKFDASINIPVSGNYTFYTSSDDGSKLYIGGYNENHLVVNNDGLHGTRERSGSLSLDAGNYPITVTFFENGGGEYLDVKYQGPGLSKQLIPSSALKDPDVNATTLALPPLPNDPGNLLGKTVDVNKIELTWNDNSVNEELFEIFRSVSNNSSYKLLTTVPSNQSGFIDDNLFSNVTYFYKVRAKNLGGYSSFSNEVSARTNNIEPELTDIQDVIMKYGTTFNINLFAEDLNDDELIFKAKNLPPFAVLNDHGDGTGSIQLTPTQAQINTYENIIISVEDQYLGSDADTISIIVSNNDLPVISEIQNVYLNEGEHLSFSISATDLNEDSLTWSVMEYPEFVSFTDNGNNALDLVLSPDYIHSGTYEIEVTVSDQKGGFDTETLMLEINDVDPNLTIYANIKHNASASLPWNNINSVSTTNLLDSDNEHSNIDITFETNWWKTWDDGTVTGNNSGLYPDVVMQDYYYFGIFGGPETVDIKISDLDTGRNYSIKLFASSTWSQVSDNGETVFSIDDISVPLYVQANTTNSADFEKIKPTIDGEIIIRMGKGSNASVGYLNSIVIESIYNDGNPPAAVTNLSAEIRDGGVFLSWKDVPFNEKGFEIYRSENIDGTYELLDYQEIQANETEFEDNLVGEGNTYFYKIRAFNDYGYSDYSDITQIIVPNTPPLLNLVENEILVEIDQQKIVNISSTDLPNNNISLLVNNLPDFVSFTDFGSGQGQLVITPSSENLGIHDNIQLVAVDDQGAIDEELISIKVTHEIVSSVFFNFNKNHDAASPWNNSDRDPVIGDTFSGLKDNSGNTTNVSITLLTDFGGVYNEGATTGDNSGVVPDNVLKEYFWFGVFGAPESVSMKVSGLSNQMKYNFSFVGSSIFSGSGITDNGETQYSIGNKSVSVDVQANTSQKGEIFEVSPNSNGEVVINISKGSGASVGYINGLIIDAFEAEDVALDPTNLTSTGVSYSEIELSWDDNTDGEIGYEVYRASVDSEDSYSLLVSLSQDVTSYIDDGLSSGAQFLYKVRAKFLDGYTDFSNIAHGSTVMYNVFINMNGDPQYDTPEPWNNFGLLPDNNQTYAGFKNNDGNPTGIQIEFTQSLTGSNDWGTSTGDNSGVFPDKVLKSFFFMEALETAHLTIAGLDQALKYNFIFFGAIETGYNVYTSFSIGDESVVNYSTYNYNNTSRINGVVPDENNEIDLMITSATNSRWSIFNAMVIETLPANANSPTTNGRLAFNDPTDIEGVNRVRYGNHLSDQGVYPNPFVDELNLFFVDAANGDCQIFISDLYGKQVFTKKAHNLSTGELKLNQEELDHLPSGIYILSMIFSDGEMNKLKVFKN